MQLFDRNISNETAFWDALKCTYAYYKESIEFNVHDGKLFACRRKSHYMKDCPDKEKFKGFTHMYRKGKPRTKEEKHGTKYHKAVPGRKKDYTKEKPHNKQPKEYSKEEKGDAFARMLAARAAKFEKKKRKQ
ncbi:2569_t:CDS:2 [Gigaspora margarita]|uniref:2569_t:CDS:1 n=1 Tax=Gigaspora margarita TaxID=4874 RepID=A0ABN7UJV5_GIGMA|nr:2569_t:CDS:2 [Gigaspora margarita]